MATDTDIAIVGGGLNGLTLALALSSAGFRVAILEASPPSDNPQDFDGRAYALALTARRMLQTLGVWSDLAENAQPMLDIKVTDGRAGEGAAPFFMHFDHSEIEEGPMGYMVEDRHLRPALVSALTSDRIDHRTGCRVTAQTVGPASMTLHLSDGAQISASLVVGCDGKSSGTADRAGIRRTEWSYDQSALVAAVGHARPHLGTAHQFFMASGPLAILPLTGNRSSIVWTETTAEAARIAAMDDAGFLDELRPRFGEFLGELTLQGARGAYPLGLSLAQSLSATRLVLVGDAAHGVHPIAGQGLNAGLRDIAALAELLTDAKRRGEDIGSDTVLARYQQWRRFDVATLAMATDGFNRLFSNDNPGLRTLRDLGLGAVQSLPSLKRSFIREAAGLTGDLPRLMEGRAL